MEKRRPERPERPKTQIHDQLRPIFRTAIHRVGRRCRPKIKRCPTKQGAQNRASDGADASDDLFTNSGEDTKSWSVGTSEQEEAFKDEVARIGRRSKVADMPAANTSGKGLLGDG